MQKRRRFKQQLTLQERLTAWSKEVLDQAAKLSPGPERDADQKGPSGRCRLPPG
jgi:hypothetical protein